MTEGEPDWLSVSQCMRGRAAVLGIAANPSVEILRSVLARELGAARFVVVLAHRSKGTRHTGETSDVATIEIVERSVHLGVSIKTAPFHERDDCNDYHQRGALAARIDRLLAEGMGHA